MPSPLSPFVFKSSTSWSRWKVIHLMTPKDAQDLKVGRTRVRDVDGFCGTVYYVGPVASAKNGDEVYVGISWDDPSRGKHDGSVICRRTKQLVRHFSSRGGSFIKLSKVDTGVALSMSLIRTKYVEPGAPLVAPNNILPHSVRTSSGREKQIELYGEIKLRDQQQVESLSRLSLRNMGVSSIGIPILGLPQILDLDLGGNLLCDWDILPGIIQAFPSLVCLSLASNRLGDMELQPGLTHDRLVHLNICSCGLKSFRTVQILDEVFPCIEKLCAAANDLRDLESAEMIAGFKALIHLDISSCGLNSWDHQIQKLSQLPCLETLLINSNPIDLIPNLVGRVSWPKLKNLGLTSISVNDWEDLQGLQFLPSLRSLSLRDTPLTSPLRSSESRFMIIARFSNLETLNASVITSSERTEAEKRYVLLVVQQLLLANMVDSEKESFLAQKHPQFSVLAEKYHQEIERSCSSFDNEQSAAFAVNVTIKSLSAESCENPPIEKRLPTSLTVGRLKALCAREFGVSFDQLTLHCKSEFDAFPRELESDECTLGFYGITDGSEILLDHLHVCFHSATEETIRQNHRRRVLEQEDEISRRLDLHKGLRKQGLL